MQDGSSPIQLRRIVALSVDEEVCDERGNVSAVAVFAGGEMIVLEVVMN